MKRILLRDLDELRADAHSARERYDLYRARVYEPRPTSSTRLRELQRICEGAEGRLMAAEADKRSDR